MTGNNFLTFSQENHPFLSIESENLPAFINHIAYLMPLFDTMSNIVFFIKDTQARYILANKTLVIRTAHQHQNEIIGLTSDELFPTPQGHEYTQQDLKVLKGHQIVDKLELHTYLSGGLGWCITHKIPIKDKHNHIIAMAGISIDIAEDNNKQLKHHKRLDFVIKYITDNIDQKISVSALAQEAKLSVSQFERLFKLVFNLSPIQMIQKIRLELAIENLLNSETPIVEIATICGYGDQSAFSRQFKKFTNLSPSDFRQQMKLA